VGWKPKEFIKYLGSHRVEREPMWDGNYLLLQTRKLLHRVEREPMWDGNVEKNAQIDLLFLVEREPMWDGNVIYK